MDTARLRLERLWDVQGVMEGRLRCEGCGFDPDGYACDHPKQDGGDWDVSHELAEDHEYWCQACFKSENQDSNNEETANTAALF